MTPEAQLLYAAWCGHTPRVRELLSAGVFVDTRDGKGRTPLMLAAYNRATEAVALLLQYGADTSARNHGNRAVIDYVSTADVARLLLAHMLPEARIAAATRLLFTVRTNPELLQYAIEARGCVNARNKRGDTPLVEHSWGEHSEEQAACIRLLLQAGANPHARNCHQETPMRLALSWDNLALVQLLLAAGVCANECLNNRGELPLHHTHSAKMAHVLVSAGADVNATDGDGLTPLMRCNGQQADLIRYFLQAGAGVNTRNAEGSALTHIGTMNEEVAQLLCDAGARYCRDIPGDVAAAVRNEYTIWLKELLATGLNIHCPVEEGRTPLQLAAWGGRKDALRLLLEAGAAASINYRDTEEGVTALHAAVIACRDTWSASPENVAMLLAAGADTNLADHDGWTPLHSCVYYELSELVPTLLKAGANPRQRNLQGATPEEFAASLGHHKMAKLLHSKRYNV